MINPGDEVQYDFREGCTEEEAVAKLLGWMRGERRLVNLQLSADGFIDPAQLPHLGTLPCPLEQFIVQEREPTSIRFLKAVEEGKYEEAQKWEERVFFWDEIAKKVGRYKLAIQKELSLSNSMLKIHPDLTAETGVRHITLPSLDSWARELLGVSALDNEEIATIGGFRTDSPEALSENFAEKTQQQRFDALRPEIEQILSGMENPTPGKVMAELRKKIGSANTCVLSNQGNAIKWENANGDTKLLTTQALAERIKTWKKYRLSKG